LRARHETAPATNSSLPSRDSIGGIKVTELRFYG
jgi:hypothetical protein